MTSAFPSHTRTETVPPPLNLDDRRSVGNTSYSVHQCRFSSLQLASCEISVTVSGRFDR